MGENNKKEFTSPPIGDSKWKTFKKSNFLKFGAPIFIFFTIVGIVSLEIWVVQSPANPEEFFDAMLRFFTADILQHASLFLGIVALCGMLLLRKSFSETLKGTFNTIIGVTILTIGTDFLIGSILDLNTAVREILDLPVSADDSGNILSKFGTTIGASMLIAFSVNLLVARFTKIKHIFLTGHMLFWFSFIFVSAGLMAGLSGFGLLAFTSVFLSIYVIVSPWLLTPHVRKVTGTNDFTLGHATGMLSVISAYTAKTTNKIFKSESKSTETVNIPKKFDFLRETSIVSAIVVFVMYVIIGYIGLAQNVSVVPDTSSVFVWAFIKGVSFGAGIAVMMYGVRLMLGALVPAFQGIAEKLVPNAIPALDAPVIFPYAPNAVIISFINGFIWSTILLIILVFSGFTSTLGIVLLPLTVTCFFEIGTAGVIANAYDGKRGTIIGTSVASIVMMFLLAGSVAVLSNVEGWLTIFGGNDFSLWGMIAYGFGVMF